MADVTCPVPTCGHVERVASDRPLVLASIALFVCDSCGFRSVFGRSQFRVTVAPHIDDKGVRWTRHAYQDPMTKQPVFVVDLDPQHAARVAVNVLTITVGT